MGTSLTKFVQDNVNPADYYQWVFSNTSITSGENRVLSPFSNEKTPSLMINGSSGKWNDLSGGGKGEKSGGPSIISFHAALEDEKQIIAARQLFSKFIHPTIKRSVVKHWARVLRKTPIAKKYIVIKRLLSPEFIKEMNIGWDGDRITIPVENEFGLFVNAKLYDFAAKAKSTKKFTVAKMLNYSDKKDHKKPNGEKMKFGSPVMIYPFSAFKLAEKEGYIVVTEGEWDALFLLSIGIPAVTSTGGSESWPVQYNHMFRSLDVIIAYDNDSAGFIGRKKWVIPNLSKYAKSIKVLKIPKLAIGEGKKTKDVLDWALTKKSMRKKSGWLEKFEKRATLVLKNDEKDIIHEEILHVPLDKASLGKYYHKQIKVKALVSGKINSPYVIPRKYRVSCAQLDSCDACPLREYNKEFQENSVQENDPELLKLLDVSDKAQREMLQRKAGFIKTTDACKCKVDTISSMNVEQLLLIPTLDSDSVYTNRMAYYVGHGLAANKAYEFKGTTTSSPRTQHAIHLFDKASPIEGEIDTFSMTDDIYAQLKVFQPKGKETPLGKLMKIADWQARNVTEIIERPDLHMAVDMSFHSVKEFRFNGSLMKKGMMDVLIFGDGACGKGWVSERLGGYYGVGSVVSGENCTFAGLVGGVQSTGKQFLVTWGAIPLNNGGHVIIDEAGALGHEEWSRMSRVRSEGVAEINKIVSEKTQAYTRLLWLANEKNGKPIMSLNTGVEGIKQLIGANEDIRRFDVALTVAIDEVPSELINTLNPVDYSDSGKYPAELCKQLLMWLWSRTVDQIEFSEAAEKEIIKQSIKFGRMYSAEIPLIQTENVRYKICKWAIWAAGRLFSTDPTGEKLIIQSKHVRTACQVVDGFYEKESMNYKMFSEQKHSTGGNLHDKKVIKIFSSNDANRAVVIEGLLRLHIITTDNLADYCDGDLAEAKILIGTLVQAKCLSRVKNGYLKNQAFSMWLRGQGGM